MELGFHFHSPLSFLYPLKPPPQYFLFLFCTRLKISLALWVRLQEQECLCFPWCRSQSAIYLIHLLLSTGKFRSRFYVYNFPVLSICVISQNMPCIVFQKCIFFFNILCTLFLHCYSEEAFIFAGCTAVLILAISARCVFQKKTPRDPLFYGNLWDMMKMLFFFSLWVNKWYHHIIFCFSVQFLEFTHSFVWWIWLLAWSKITLLMDLWHFTSKWQVLCCMSILKMPPNVFICLCLVINLLGILGRSTYKHSTWSHDLLLGWLFTLFNVLAHDSSNYLGVRNLCHLSLLFFFQG